MSPAKSNTPNVDTLSTIEGDITVVMGDLHATPWNGELARITLLRNFLESDFVVRYNAKADAVFFPGDFIGDLTGKERGHRLDEKIEKAIKNMGKKSGELDRVVNRIAKKYGNDGLVMREKATPEELKEYEDAVTKSENLAKSVLDPVVISYLGVEKEFAKFRDLYGGSGVPVTSTLGNWDTNSAGLVGSVFHLQAHNDFTIQSNNNDSPIYVQGSINVREKSPVHALLTHVFGQVNQMYVPYHLGEPITKDSPQELKDAHDTELSRLSNNDLPKDEDGNPDLDFFVCHSYPAPDMVGLGGHSTMKYLEGKDCIIITGHKHATRVFKDKAGRVVVRCAPRDFAVIKRDEDGNIDFIDLYRMKVEKDVPMKKEEFLQEYKVGETLF